MVDFDFRLAGLTALVERGQVHEGELDRPLNFVNVGAGEKDDRASRVDALDRLAQSMRLWIGEKPEHRLLRAIGIA